MGKRKPHENHVRLYRHELESEAFRSLSVTARALLVEFRSLYFGRENRIFISVREIMRRLGVSQRPAQNARDELLDRGFIRLLTPASFTRKVVRAPEYVLTNVPINNEPGATAPKDFMSWPNKKNTVAASATGCSGRDYRGNSNNVGKCPVGSENSYREGQHKTGDGSVSRYTDKLPPGGVSNWLAIHGGWRCRNGKVLNTCCAICGVWITPKGFEFDGAKHSCDAAARQAHKSNC